MNALQVIGLVLGAIALAAQQLTGTLPQFAPYTAIVGSIASALLVAINHQAQASDAPPKVVSPSAPPPKPLITSATALASQVAAQPASGLPAQPAPAVIIAPTTGAKS